MLISGKVKEPSSFKKLAADCDISTSVQDVYKILYTVASETCVWSFQYKILNRILFTNAKLFKIGLKESEKWSSCNTHKEDLFHLFFNCSYAQEFWKSFIAWWYGLSGESLNLGLKSIIVGIVDRVDVLNYLIILGKLCIWECRKIKGYLILGCFRKR